MSKLRILISVILVSLFIVCGVLYFNYINKDNIEEGNNIDSDYSDVTNVPVIDAKLGEESEYITAKTPLVIRKIEEYSVDEIIE